MPIYKDENKEGFYKVVVQTGMNSETGKQGKTTKQGFKTKKEAKEWEMNYHLKLKHDPKMTFQCLYELYIEDLSVRLAKSTIIGKQYLFEDKILPVFKDRKISEIDATDVRKWQNDLLTQDYKDTYLRSINNQLTAIFNYAVKFYDLRANPCHKAGTIGKDHASPRPFLTKEQYDKFIEVVTDPTEKLGYQIMYWSGVRIGELLALTPNDLDFVNNVIHINHSYSRVEKEDVIKSPKTEKGYRHIAVPQGLMDDIKEYISHLYKIKPKERIFPYTKRKFENHVRDRCLEANVTVITSHGLRHSNASLLAELGYSPQIVKERLGHEKISTTIDTYSHIFPSKQKEVANKLEELY